MAASPQSSSYKCRTLVFTAPKGSRLQYADFDFLLRNFRSKIEAFGTVGVGFIWHLTLKTPEDIDPILAVTDEGNIFVKNVIPVHVCKFIEIQHSATLFWLPYWVPNDHVSKVVSQTVGTKSTCSYVRIPQGSLHGCYSTQRRLVCPAGLAKLPHFLPIDYEGVTHRCFLFVPGRPPICFKCGSVGHMKSTCAEKSRQTKPQTLVTPDAPLNVIVDHEQDDIHNVLNSPTPSESQLTDPVTDELNQAYEQLPQPEGEHHSYQIVVQLPNGKIHPIGHSEGSTDAVYLPKYQHTPPDYYEFLQHLTSKCNFDKCNLIDKFLVGCIPFKFMKGHLKADHPTFGIICLEED
jgi:hypothetical protein